MEYVVLWHQFLLLGELGIEIGSDFGTDSGDMHAQARMKSDAAAKHLTPLLGWLIAECRSFCQATGRDGLSEADRALLLQAFGSLDWKALGNFARNRQTLLGVIGDTLKGGLVTPGPTVVNLDSSPRAGPIPTDWAEFAKAFAAEFFERMKVFGEKFDSSVFYDPEGSAHTKRGKTVHGYGVQFLTNYYAQRDGLDADRARQAADERMELIRDIQNLLGLSANPRMLSFIADLSHDDLLQARGATGKITSAQLYHQLLDRWLKGEVKRRAVTGGVRVLAEQHLWDAVTGLAMRIWQSGQRSVHVDELTDQIAREICELRTLDMTVAEAAHQVGSVSLLVREQDQRFAFVHRSVMEWLVARRAAQQIQAGEVAEVLAAREMSPLMADFLMGLASRDVADRWATQTLTAPV